MVRDGTLHKTYERGLLGIHALENGLDVRTTLSKIPKCFVTTTALVKCVERPV